MDNRAFSFKSSVSPNRIGNRYLAEALSAGGDYDDCTYENHTSNLAAP